MIILHGHKVIFIRCRKTASTSLEIELSKHARSDDVITPISPRDETIRKEHGGRAAQNYMRGGCEAYFNHMSAAEIKATLSENAWNSYFKFCIERNPWEKVISMFFHRFGRRTTARTLTEFIATGEFLDARNFQLYCDRSTVIVDRIGKYENLDADLRSIFDSVGLSYSGLSTHAKSQFRQVKRPYQEYFTADDQQIVADEFSEEISLHEYTF